MLSSFRTLSKFSSVSLSLLFPVQLVSILPFFDQQSTKQLRSHWDKNLRSTLLIFGDNKFYLPSGPQLSFRRRDSSSEIISSVNPAQRTSIQYLFKSTESTTSYNFGTDCKLVFINKKKKIKTYLRCFERGHGSAGKSVGTGRVSVRNVRCWSPVHVTLYLSSSLSNSTHYSPYRHLLTETERIIMKT